MRGLLIPAGTAFDAPGSEPGGAHPSTATRPAPSFDPALRYRLDPQVTLRPEPFGALAYHYGSRRLTFLRSKLLAQLVAELAGHGSAGEAVTAVVPEPERPAYLRALASLAESRFICAG
ncbi:MAG: mycofactocin biosynthesis chaperone MftB [Acidimicrobiales bacterium]